MTKGFDEYYYTVSVYGNIKVDKGKVPTRKEIKVHVKENISKYLSQARIEHIENRKTQTSYLEMKEDKQSDKNERDN